MDEWLKEIQHVIDSEPELCKARRKQGITKREFAIEVVQHLNKIRSISFNGGFKFKLKGLK